MSEPQRIQSNPSVGPAPESNTSQQQAAALVRDARTLLGDMVEHTGSPSERLQALDTLNSQLLTLTADGVDSGTAAELRTLFTQLNRASSVDAREAGVTTVDWMTRQGVRRSRPNRAEARVSRAAGQALAGLRDAVRSAPNIARHAVTSRGADGITRDIVGASDNIALGANFSRVQLARAATGAGATDGLAEQIVSDVRTRATDQLASQMIDVAEARMQGLSEQLHTAALSPEPLVQRLIAAPMQGLRLLSELGAPTDELRRLSADINRFRDPDNGLGPEQRAGLRREIVGLTMGLAHDASRTAAEAGETLEELREEEPGKIFATFPWAVQEAANSLPGISRAMAARIAHGQGTGSLLARAVYDRRGEIASHDRMVSVAIKVGVFLAHQGANAIGGREFGAVVGITGTALAAGREVIETRETAVLTQAASAAGLNSHEAGRRARVRAGDAETAAAVDVAKSIVFAAAGGSETSELREAAQEAVSEFATPVLTEAGAEIYERLERR